MNEQQLRERSFISGLLADATATATAWMSAVITLLKNNTFKVQLSNDKALEKGLAEVRNATNSLKKNVFSVEISNQKDYREWYQAMISELNSLGDKIEQLIEVSCDETPLKKSEDGTKQVILALNQLKTGLLDIQRALVFPQPPKIQQITGKIEVTNQKYADNTKIEENLQKLIQITKDNKIEIPKFPEPKEVKIPEEFKVKEMDKLMSLFTEISQKMQEYAEKLDSIPKTLPKVEFPDYINVGNFPVQRIPPTVTNFNINPLRGGFKSTAMTINTTATKIPGVALANRRSLIIFNNSTKTIYLGGEDVEAVNGLPIPPSSYSPPFDNGINMNLYGIVETGTANIRVLEASNEAIGG